MTPRPDKDKNFAVTETTGLLKKAYDSTGSLPLASSYGDVRDSIEQQLQHTNAKTPADGPSPFRKRQAIGMLLGGSTLCALLIAALFWRPHHHQEHHDEQRHVPLPGSSVSAPFSDLDPVHDLGLAEHVRSKAVAPQWGYLSPSFKSPHDKRNALPTNSWYQNLLMARDEPSNLQRAYPAPYLVDLVGMIPGLRAHVTHVEGNAEVMQLSFNEEFGLVLGATKSIAAKNDDDTKEWTSNKYTVTAATNLGVTLEWDSLNMTSNIVRGMSFVTMEYEKNENSSIFPTIASPLEMVDPILVDGSDIKLRCSSDGVSDPILAKRDLEMYFHQSDFAWMVFLSEPAWITCIIDKERRTLIQIIDYEAAEEGCNRKEKLVMRAALLDQCMTNANPISCRNGLGHRLIDEPKKGEYTELLRAHVDIYPGPNTAVSYDITDPTGDQATLHFDWDPQSMSDECPNNSTKVEGQNDMLMFALPHHMDRFAPQYLPNGKRYCKSSLTGPMCLVRGSGWSLSQILPQISFRASRPPKPHFIPRLGFALVKDIKFRLPAYVKRGSGDTYFSGKFLAKLARILTVAEEVEELCGKKGFLERHIGGYLQFCRNSTLPSQSEVRDAFQELREGVEVWINGTAETPFVYDRSWGGVISCGCYMENEKCINKYPDCPGFSDQGLNFGNGFYNDHHFHYGYHIYAAAAVAYFDPAWGKKHFEQVLMLIRDIANPSKEDSSFPLFRHKDWYLGSSWASGTTIPPHLNGNNQESSSEAIAAYEGVALFGQVMEEVWRSADDKRNAAISSEISKVGRLLTSTELTSAKKYWHVTSKDDPQRIYPEIYTAHCIGILWNTMAQFGTWFGAAGYLPIGIQLLPLTAISESRDDLSWINAVYEPLTKACAADFRCTTSGWSVLQLAVFATIGYKEEAVMRVRELPDDSFENAGGNGHSRTNTIWYIATRPDVQDPIPMLSYDLRGKEEVQPTPEYELNNCYLPKTCTPEVLGRLAGDFTCAERIVYLIKEEEQTQWDACWRVGGLEYENICGPCNPGVHYSGSKTEEDKKKHSKDTTDVPQPVLVCPPCSQKQCDSDLNRCPVYKRTFVCTEGTSKGGCTGDPKFWAEEQQCDSCCEMSDCLKLKDKEAQKLTRDGNAFEKSSCPPCEPKICYGKINQCPIHTAPYVCTDGPSFGGCSASPWDLSSGQCSECCEIKLEC
ncbi:glycosyl hydrolase family 81 protein [Nitzschia inconspicua]|uniref:glucan endo-1,3-beta-D-glucosidase n=1 Tax=Nitzschia inconspicua TaxID=303405 RepID=A0A9K3KIE0_9STRA|nr:glycosyl hydrolase family 81 protein [Nitzschia inconspicua]